MPITRGQFVKLQQEYQSMLVQLREKKDLKNLLQAQTTQLTAEIQQLNDALDAKQLEIRNADVGNS